jgi:hypothetical protein
MNEIVLQICTVTYATQARLNYPNYGIQEDSCSVDLCALTHSIRTANRESARE